MVKRHAMSSAAERLAAMRQAGRVASPLVRTTGDGRDVERVLQAEDPSSARESLLEACGDPRGAQPLAAMRLRRDRAPLSGASGRLHPYETVLSRPGAQ